MVDKGDARDERGDERMAARTKKGEQVGLGDGRDERGWRIR